jgi:hypothetical protein
MARTPHTFEDGEAERIEKVLLDGFRSHLPPF